jgi:hypothetical protein
VKRVLAITALVLGTAGVFAVPASASTACVHLSLNVNGQVVDRTQCV